MQNKTKGWTEADLARLRADVESGGGAARAAVISDPLPACGCRRASSACRSALFRPSADRCWPKLAGPESADPTAATRIARRSKRFMKSGEGPSSRGRPQCQNNSAAIRTTVIPLDPIAMTTIQRSHISADDPGPRRHEKASALPRPRNAPGSTHSIVINAGRH
jgi:hypothetical protein